MQFSTCLYTNPQDIENSKYKRNVKFSLTMRWQIVIYAYIECAETQQSYHDAEDQP